MAINSRYMSGPVLPNANRAYRKAHASIPARSVSLNREHPLGIEVTVRNQPNDKWGDDGAPRLSRIRGTYLEAAGRQALCEIAAQGDKPTTPDKELQEHQHAQPQPHGSPYQCRVMKDGGMTRRPM
jgi:hypothetical protein